MSFTIAVPAWLITAIGVTGALIILLFAAIGIYVLISFWGAKWWI